MNKEKQKESKPLTRISARIPEKTEAYVQALAEYHNTTASAVVREILEEQLTPENLSGLFNSTVIREAVKGNDAYGKVVSSYGGTQAYLSATNKGGNRG